MLLENVRLNGPCAVFVVDDFQDAWLLGKVDERGGLDLPESMRGIAGLREGVDAMHVFVSADQRGHLWVPVKQPDQFIPAFPDKRYRMVGDDDGQVFGMVGQLPGKPLQL